MPEFPPFDGLITVTYDDDEGRPIYNLGDLDEYAAVTILLEVAERIRSRWLEPRSSDDPPEVPDDEGDG